MEKPHYEEHERQMTGKTFTEAVNGFAAIVEGRKPAEAQHIIVQLEKHVRNQEMNPIIFKNGQKAKVGEALAHRAMKMHDSMSQGDKQQFVSHISKSIDHFKSGLKGAWKQTEKKGITLAGPKLRKEESDRPKQNTKTDVYVRKHTRLAADALGRAHQLGKDHKDYKKNMAEYERHRKMVLGEEHEDDDGWYAHKEMHGSKAISKEDWKKGVRPKKSMKKEEAEHIEEAGKSKLQRYVNAAKPERHDPKKGERRRAGISMALKKIIGSDAIGRKPRVKATMEEADQIDEWGMRSIRGPHAKTSSMAITPPKVGYKGKTRKPKVQRIDTTPDKM